MLCINYLPVYSMNLELSTNSFSQFLFTSVTVTAPQLRETRFVTCLGSRPYSPFSCSDYGSSSLVAQMVNRLPTVQETRIQCLGREDPLEKAMAPHSSTLARKIPWIEEPDKLQSMWSQRVRLSDFTFTFSLFNLRSTSHSGPF